MLKDTVSIILQEYCISEVLDKVKIGKIPANKADILIKKINEMDLVEVSRLSEKFFMSKGDRKTVKKSKTAMKDLSSVARLHGMKDRWRMTGIAKGGNIISQGLAGIHNFIFQKMDACRDAANAIEDATQRREKYHKCQAKVINATVSRLQQLLSRCEDDKCKNKIGKKIAKLKNALRYQELGSIATVV